MENEVYHLCPVGDAVGVVYGGHVPDPEDLEEVGCVARGLLSPVAPPCWGGPGGLLSIIDPLPDHHGRHTLTYSVTRTHSRTHTNRALYGVDQIKLNIPSDQTKTLEYKGVNTVVKRQL